MLNGQCRQLEPMCIFSIFYTFKSASYEDNKKALFKIHYNSRVQRQNVIHWKMLQSSFLCLFQVC